MRTALGLMTLFGALAASMLPASGADWPQWRGPTRDGVAPPQEWSWKWPEEGPRQIWTANVGQGYASLIASGGRIFAFGRVWEKAEGKKWVELLGDCVQCLDADTGKVLWRTKVGEGKGELVTSTPTTDGKLVFSVTWDGNVTALDARTGKEVWKVNVVKEYKTSQGGFHGIANSPLLAGDVLVLAQGVGLDRNTGKLVWQNTEAMTGCHASPVLCPAGSQPGVLVFGKLLTRLDPATGKTLWQGEETRKLGQGYMDPIVMGDRILIVAGPGRNRFRFDASSVTPDDKDLFKGPWGYAGAGDLANPVRWKEYLFAPRMSSSDRSGMFYDNPGLSLSCLECFDLNTMKKVWTQPGLSGTPIVCDGKIILQGQWGDLRVVEASSDGYKELANAKVFSPRSGDPKNPFGKASFATPVLLNGRLYCRFFTGEAFCLDVSKDYPNPDPNVGRRRIVGEVCTVTGVLSAKGADKPDYVVGLLTEDRQASKQENPKVYVLCARQHNDDPHAMERILPLVAKGAHVSVTGTLMYDDQLSVNVMEEVAKTGGAAAPP